MPPIEPDSPCCCEHVFDEHPVGGGCSAIIEVHERQVQCPCVAFDLDVEAIT